jgi:hypothetical protein
MTLAAIGAHLGVSKGRAQQLVAQGERREQDLKNCGESPFYILSVRAQNCLLAENYENAGGRLKPPSPQVVRAWLDSGRLKKIPNMGKKSILEVAAWLAGLGA